MRKIWMTLLLWLSVCVAAPAATCPGEADYSVFDVLDAATPAHTRKLAVDTVARLSEVPGCAHERYLLGTLYRFGPELPGNPLPKDSARATALLESYAAEGRPRVYADLAELALVDGDASAAMQWTQVYLASQTASKYKDFDRAGYNANLLLRSQKAWQKARLGGQGKVQALLDAYMAQHPSLAKDTAARNEPDPDPVRIKRAPKGRTDVTLRIKPGYAIFLMEVMPDGQVGRIVAESFAPTPEQARTLRPFVEGFEYYPLSDDKPQVVRVPVQYGYTGANSPRLKSN